MKDEGGESDSLWLLKGNKDVQAKLSDKELEANPNLDHHFRHVDTIFKRSLAHDPKSGTRVFGARSCALQTAPDTVRTPQPNWILVLLGLGNSGVDHWQSYWCLAFRNVTRVLQDDWDNPTLASWLNRLDAALAGGRARQPCLPQPLLLARRALGGAQPAGRVKAAFLVAPSDLKRPDAPPATRDFCGAAPEISCSDAGRCVYGR